MLEKAVFQQLTNIIVGTKQVKVTELQRGGLLTMKDKPMKNKHEKKAEQFENYGLEPEMSLQNVKFATTENKYLNEQDLENEE